ncbi:MAG: MFS transporter [Deltaproteobacteria bacterium]|jgi:acyl-[acyl-carrier-protein]-phospholipid O-acyltransferase/long-chain-fatty-acid--[acyl-carrier-protein] ligase|nr:MFS transporter [Deltaproteobacteria bacterium]
MDSFLTISRKRDFWPLFVSMGLGAFNDNFFRQALISMLAFGAFELSPAHRSMFGSLATGLMILPFFLFSSLAGQLSDRYHKSLMLKLTKGFELAIMVVSAGLFIYGDFRLLILTLFLMGTQSAFFGPVKYGLLPEVLGERELVAGNGLVGGFSFMAIVLGTTLGSYLITLSRGPKLWVPIGLVAVSLLGFLAAMRQPRSSNFDVNIKIEPKIWLSTGAILSSVRKRQDIWLAILAISWFWAMGSILLTQLPILAATRIGATPSVSTALVTILALGVAIGSLGVQRLLKGQVSAVLAPISSILLAVLTALLALIIYKLPVVTETGSVTLEIFFTTPIYLALAIVCLLITISGGVFVVPLNAVLQHRSGLNERARVIAANNIMNSLFMAVGSLLVLVLVKIGLSLAQIFLGVAISAAVVTVITVCFLPEEVIKTIVRLIIRLLYRPKIKGLEHLGGLTNGPILVIPNHTSFIDVAFLVGFLPRRLTFAIDLYRAQAWWVRLFLKLYKTVPINPAQPLAARELVAAIEEGDMVVIFPEGRLTTTGSITKVYDGPGLIASHCRCPLLPIIFHGLEYTRFGKFRHIVKNKPKRYKVSMTICEPVNISEGPLPHENRRDYRHRVTGEIYEIMVQAMFKSREWKLNIYTALMRAAHSFGYNRPIFEDYTRKKITYSYLIKLSKILGRIFQAKTTYGEYVGILLPNTSVLLGLAFGLWGSGRIPVMLNYSQGRKPFVSALAAASVKLVITSRAFIREAKLEGLVEDITAKVIYLDEIKISICQKILGLLWRPKPAPPETPAVVLFTSGSEDRPKGVVLSHQGIIANIWQARSLIEINEDDTLFNPMPAFHAFGFNVGMILPLVSGMRSYSHVSPLHVKAIPELIYDTMATIVIGGNSFAASWGRNAHPYDFFHVRFMLLGAEKLKNPTMELYFHKLGIRLFEGYGVTEGSPIIAVASRMRVKDGTVGHILPGIEHRIEPVPGLTTGGRLLVRGPNLLMGYLTDEKSGVLDYRAPEDWYDTGDICEIDDEGFVRIVGRARRFAKISGEMISLAAVEEVAFELWPERPLAVLARPDPYKGERLVLVHLQDFTPDLGALRNAIKRRGSSDLSIPKMALAVDSMPLTPLGKVDMPSLIAKVDQMSKDSNESEDLKDDDGWN